MPHHNDPLRALQSHAIRGLALAAALGMLYYIALTVVLSLL